MRMLQREQVVRGATAGPDGPHAVPLGLVWEPEGGYCATSGDPTTLSNVRRDSRVALVLAVARAWPEPAGAAVPGSPRARRPRHPDFRGPISRWYDKYREPFGRRGFRWFAETTRDLWSLRVEPHELASWDHGAGPFSAAT